MTFVTKRLRSILVWVCLALTGAALVVACGTESEAPIASTAHSACSPGLTTCFGICVDTLVDPAHCGACGAVCKPGSQCEAGVCVPSCDGGDALCETGCADLASDPANCGACGKACDAGAVCSKGACASSCAEGTSACGASCVDLDDDDDNCGQCGHACDPMQLCLGGQCIVGCGNLAACGEVCADLSLDPVNCGECGLACVVGQACVEGACAPVCGVAILDCDGVCTDPSFDPMNCGGCGVVCPAGLVCSQGACEADCGGGSTKCGDACVDVANDPAHCGACDVSCGGGEICTGGACAPCPPGMALCSDVCIDTSSNLENCGGCGDACPYAGWADVTCVDGVCGSTCKPGHYDCDGDGDCYDYLNNDPFNCGSCGNVCGPGEFCQSGACVGCPPGQTLCGNGCANLSSDIYNCGACGNDCPYAPSATRTCVGGVCGFVCQGGYVDCDGLPSNGCEMAIASDPQNCGTCGLVCGPNQICSQGLCSSCPVGKSRCGNTCVDLLNNAQNCGACGAACVANADNATGACVSGQCVLQCLLGFLECDGNGLNGCEVDASSPNNCGACGVVCAGNDFCAKNTCAVCAPTPLAPNVPASASGTTVGQSDRFSLPCAAGNAPDAYFSFTAPVVATYTFDTIGSSFDTVLGLRAGDCGGPSLGCNDDGGGGVASKLSVNLAAGQTVIVIVDGDSSAQGSYVLHVN